MARNTFNTTAEKKAIIASITTASSAYGEAKRHLIVCLKAGRKGLETIIEAARELADPHRDEDGKIIATSDEIAALRTALRRASADEASGCDEVMTVRCTDKANNLWEIGPAARQAKPVTLNQQWADTKAQRIAKDLTETLKGRRNKQALLLELVADLAAYLEIDPEHLTSRLEELYNEPEAEEEDTGKVIEN